MAFDELITTDNHNQLELFGAVSSLKKSLDNVGLQSKQQYEGFFEQLQAFCKTVVSS